MERLRKTSKISKLVFPQRFATTDFKIQFRRFVAVLIRPEFQVSLQHGGNREEILVHFVTKSMLFSFWLTGFWLKSKWISRLTVDAPYLRGNFSGSCVTRVNLIIQSTGEMFSLLFTLICGIAHWLCTVSTDCMFMYLTVVAKFLFSLRVFLEQASRITRPPVFNITY